MGRASPSRPVTCRQQVPMPSHGSWGPESPLCCPQLCSSSAPRAAVLSATGRRPCCRWKRWSLRSERRSAKVSAGAAWRCPMAGQDPSQSLVCPTGFAELQTDMTDLTKELNRSQGIPFLEYKHFVTRTFFPKVYTLPPACTGHHREFG